MLRVLSAGDIERRVKQLEKQLEELRSTGVTEGGNGAMVDSDPED